MIIFMILFLTLLMGFFFMRSFTILLLLSLEGMVLLLMLILIISKISQLSFIITSMSILSMAVLEAALGLCLLTMMMRYFEKEELFFSLNLKI